MGKSSVKASRKRSGFRNSPCLRLLRIVETLAAVSNSWPAACPLRTKSRSGYVRNYRSLEITPPGTRITRGDRPASAKIRMRTGAIRRPPEAPLTSWLEATVAPSVSATLRADEGTRLRSSETCVAVRRNVLELTPNRRIPSGTVMDSDFGHEAGRAKRRCGFSSADPPMSNGQRCWEP